MKQHHVVSEFALANQAGSNNVTGSREKRPPGKPQVPPGRIRLTAKAEAQVQRLMGAVRHRVEGARSRRNARKPRSFGTRDYHCRLIGRFLRFLAARNDLPNDVKVYVGTWTGTAYNISTNSLVAAGGNQSNPFSLLVPFAGFAGTATWTDVDVIVFEFDNSPSGDFAIERFEAVPEPASLLSLAIGISAIAVRRRIKR